MRPAADGTTHQPRPAIAVPPVAPGLTFHGLRHSHKTWLIADGIPDVAQARRLGHRLPDQIQHIYSHVAPELEPRLLDALQHRWTTALAALNDPSISDPATTSDPGSVDWTSAVTTVRALPPATLETGRAAS
jgi:hypothetical protein